MIRRNDVAVDLEGEGMMLVKCILLDDKNVITDNANLSFYNGSEAALIPFRKETTELYTKLKKVRFQLENKLDTIYEGEITETDDLRICLKNVNIICSPENGDQRVDVRVNVNMNARISYESGKDYFTYDIYVKNISSGGMSFCCEEEVPMDIIYEMVTDWTDPLMVVKVKLLRKKPAENDMNSYGCKYIDLLPEEESILRAGVYYIQAMKFKPKRSNVDNEMC